MKRSKSSVQYDPFKKGLTSRNTRSTYNPTLHKYKSSAAVAASAEPKKKLQKLKKDPHIERLRQSYLRFFHSLEHSPTWKDNDSEAGAKRRPSTTELSTTIANMTAIYTVLSEREFYSDITKLANCKVESAAGMQGVLRIYEVISQVNKHLVTKCKPAGHDWAIRECVKATVGFTTSFINTHNFIRRWQKKWFFWKHLKL